MRIFFIILLILVFLALLGALVFFVLKLGKNTKTSTLVASPTNLTPALKPKPIQELLAIVSDKNKKNTELSEAIEMFCLLSIPPKNGKEISKEAKIYLNFISLLCSHKNSDAKLISRLISESKKKNPHYVDDIALYEEKGINAR
ncbi:MAG: fatty-acid--CoA ligase, partial [Campylobacter sp.]|nr:fatty-acid--CoA ligase [Campylobacter sp.]